ncbi:MAG: asparagine synthase [Candidatus Sulfotelmatobacter sp.]|nr:asparagine synthase [Candidatus Sulfotelmatobacter sp.]
MPGIVGLITSKPRDLAERELNRMVEALRHESFYVSGTHTNADLGVYVGWVARRGSFADGMPLRNERGDVCLTFSGEDFPEPGAVANLKQRGHAINAEGPSYLVHVYEDDPAFPASLNGSFHGLLTDRTRGSSVLFNDRYGMNRIYYHEARDAFYFAAESKAILAVRPELRRMDARGMGEFVACGCVLGNRTLFEGIRVLPQASAWVFRNAVLEDRRTYFHPREWEQQETLEQEPYYERLRDVFSSNLPRYFNGGERVGLSLTAGLDTRMIMAWHKPRYGSLPCYSFGGMFRDSQDVLVARRVARACGQPHQVISVGTDFLSRFPHYAERTVHLTDGCVSVNHSPDLSVNERAAEIAPVRMTGNYGGEVLRHVRAFKPVQPVTDLFCPEFLPQIAAANETYHQLLQGHPLSFAVFRQAPWHHYGLLALERTQLSLRSPYLDNDFVRTVFRAPSSAMADSEVSRRLIADGDPKLAKIRTDRTPIAGQDGWRTRAVRNFLDFTVKAEYACDYGMPQWAARVDRALAPLRPERIFLGRHKFYHFRVWYRDQLSTYLREMLLDPQTLSRPYLQRAGVERIVGGHLKGTSNYTLAIHSVLTLELIHRLFVDS